MGIQIISTNPIYRISAPSVKTLTVRNESIDVKFRATLPVRSEI